MISWRKSTAKKEEGRAGWKRGPKRRLRAEIFAKFISPGSGV
jgi:hypothetical protein